MWLRTVAGKLIVEVGCLNQSSYLLKMTYMGRCSSSCPRLSNEIPFRVPGHGKGREFGHSHYISSALQRIIRIILKTAVYP